MKSCKIAACAFSCYFSGTLLYADDQQGILELEKNLQWDQQTVRRFKFSPDGKLLAATNLDWFGTRRPGKIRVWTVETAKEFVDFDLPDTGLRRSNLARTVNRCSPVHSKELSESMTFVSFKTEVTPYAVGQEIRLSPDGTTLALFRWSDRVSGQSIHKERS